VQKKHEVAKKPKQKERGRSKEAKEEEKYREQ
jgi:hypothetical protein